MLLPRLSIYAVDRGAGQPFGRGGHRDRGARREQPPGNRLDHAHAVWEDGTHLLVKMENNSSDASSYNMFRVDLDTGSVERVFEQREAGGEVQPWVLID